MRMILFAAAVAIAGGPNSVLAQAQYVPSRCGPGYYHNADGICVHKPTAVPHKGATALCRDGLYSYAHATTLAPGQGAIVAPSPAIRDRDLGECGGAFSAAREFGGAA